MKLIRTLLIAVSLGPALLPAAYAAENMTKTSAPVEAKASDSASLSRGEIKKIDKDAGKITLKHGPLVNLDMPAMTMVFKVQSPDLLNTVKVGDAVKFRAENIKGALTVTEIAPLAP